MEVEGTRIRHAKKIYSPPRETPKKKKQARKESESKLLVQGIDNTEQKLQEEELSNKTQLAQYVLKLRYQLESTKQLLKSEEIKYANLIKSVCTHFGSQDENLKELMNWPLFSQEGNSEENNKRSGFEKLFAVHKYQISDKKTEIIPELAYETSQKSKSKSTKNKDASGTIKINLKEIDPKTVDLTKESDEKPSKKKKNPPPANGEEEPAKKKRVRKNKEGNETSQRKNTEDNKTIMSPIHLSQNELSNDFDKIKKAEETINKYEELAHSNPTVNPLEMGLPNNLFHDGMKYLLQQSKNDPSLLSQQLLGDPNLNALAYNPFGNLDQNKLMDELMKMGMQDSLMRSMAVPQDLLNYYQRNYKS